MTKTNIISPYAPYINPEIFGNPDPDRLLIFDTTFRDGEQSPGAALGPDEKEYLAPFIATLGVDAMEVSFAESDPSEIEATRRVIKALGQSESQERTGQKDILFYSLARADPTSIKKVWEAVQSARLPGIHTVIATSNEHIEQKFPGKKWSNIRDLLVDSAGYAAELISKSGKYGMVEVSAEDATRTSIERLLELYSEVMKVVESYKGKVGFTFNIPDTVGLIIHPNTYGTFFSRLSSEVPGIDKVIRSTHVHNDHGLAVIASLMAAQNGARQIEGAVNGIGERAGNASLEQITMILEHDKNNEWGGLYTNMNPKGIFAASVEVAALTGYHPSRTQPVVGENVRSHEAGIHQHGQLSAVKNAANIYEGIAAHEIGADTTKYPLGRRSGKHAIEYHLNLMGYNIKKDEGGKWDLEESDRIYTRFMVFAQTQRLVTHAELRNLMAEMGYKKDKPLPLEYLTHQRFYSPDKPENPEGAIVTLRIDEGSEQQQIGYGKGEVEAVFNAIKQAVGNNISLRTYVQGNKETLASEGIRSFARTAITLQDQAGKYIQCQGYDRDIGRSAAHAIANGWNEKLLMNNVAK